MTRIDFAMYHFKTTGSVTIYYNGETNYFYQEFSNGVSQKDKEWFSKILFNLNGYAKKGYRVNQLYLEFISSDSYITAHIRTIDTGILNVKYTITDKDEIFGMFDNALYLQIPMTGKIKSLYDQLKSELDKFDVPKRKGIEIVE